jgi:hypothetical protein
MSLKLSSPSFNPSIDLSSLGNDVAYCLLPAAYCLLPAAYCLLPAAY